MSNETPRVHRSVWVAPETRNLAMCGPIRATEAVLGSWQGKPCARCGGRKGPNQVARKFCYRCQILERREASERAHEARVVDTYGLGEGEYAKRYTAQGSRCALCQRATGKRRRLAVDHDHKTGKVRGLLCSICNKILGHARDDPDFFARGYHYLINGGSA